MKICPNCHMELPDEAHFCPKCMFQYGKQEIQIKSRKKKSIRPWVISILSAVAIVTIVLFMGVGLIKNRIQQMMLDSSIEEDAIDESIYDSLRTEDDINYNPENERDLQDMLGQDFTEVQDDLGEETVKAYQEQGLEIHIYGILLIAVGQDGLIQNISIDYTGEDKTMYSIYGIDGTYSEALVLTTVGVPDQDYGNEYVYQFDEMFNPKLIITFSDDHIVEKVEYYYF